MHSPTTSRSISAAALCVSLCAALPARAHPPVDETTGAARVCSEGPARAMARALGARAQAELHATKVLPNPELVVEHDRVLSTGGGHEWTAGVAVPLGIAGRRGLSQEAASLRKAAARSEAESTLLDHALGFREGFVEAASAAARVEVLGEQQRALDSLAELIRGLTKGGEAATFDLLRQQNQARSHRRAVVAAKAHAAAALRWLESSTGATVALPGQNLDLLGGGPRVLQKAQGTPGEGHPRVRSLETAARAAGMDARAARRRAVPDLGVFLGYRAVTASAGGTSATAHGFRAGLSLPLTFFDHGQGEAAKADAEGLVARASADQLRREHRGRARATSERLKLLEASRPEVEASAKDAAVLEAKARQLYAAGELSIAELLDAFRAAEEARLARIDLAEGIAMARLGLMRALGTQLDPRLDATCGSKP